MKAILWNVRGATSKEFAPHAIEVVRMHKPEIFFLLEKKSTDDVAHKLCKRLGFEDVRTVPAVGLRGGIWLFWRKPAILIDFVADSPHVLHSLFKLTPTEPDVLITGVHAPSAAKDKKKLWKILGENPPPTDTPWLLMGDMNEVLSQSEKMGGRPVTNYQGKDFSNLTDAEGMIDLKYNGPAFTWNNGREGTELIRERLDRALANAEWMRVHPHTQGNARLPVSLIRESRWQRPLGSCIKVNCDGAWQGEDKASAGVVARMSDGTWFFGKAWKVTASRPAHAELMAIHGGMQMAVDAQLKEVIIETDALSLKRSIKEVAKQGTHELAVVFRDMQALLNKDCSFTFNYVPREANNVAHILAKMAVQEEGNARFFDEAPTCARSAYEEDITRSI